MQKSYSIKNKLLLYFVCILITVIFSFSFLTVFSLRSYYQQIQLSNSDTLSIYKGELTAQMADLLSFNQELISSNYDFRTLALTGYSAVDRIKCEYALQNLLAGAVPSYGGVLVFDQINDISLYAYGSDYGYDQYAENLQLKEELKAFVRTASPDLFFSWQLYTEGSRALLLNTYRLNDMYVCSIIDLSRFSSHWDTSSNRDAVQVAFYDDTQFLSNQKYMEENEIDLGKLGENRPFPFVLFSKIIVQTAAVDDTAVSLCCVMPIGYLWTYSRISLLLIVGMSLLLCLLVVIVFRSLNRLTVYPLQQIIAAAESVEHHDISGFQSNSGNTALEFQRINEALVHLLEQKSTLEQENRLKEKNMEHAQLQYFQLQTRSHFFINSLKSLYSMLENKEYDRMKLMILAFSNHLRFVFQDNLSLVSLRSELEEVNDYYNIIRLDRLYPIILVQQVDSALLDCKVPPLLIQTFLENSVKYNGKSEQPLRFVIQADPVELSGTPYMRIRISDNGVGYGGELLEKLNCMDDNLYEKDHVGINNLKRRIHLIYGDECQLAFFNEPAGGACSLICLPLKKKEPEAR